MSVDCRWPGCGRTLPSHHALGGHMRKHRFDAGEHEKKKAAGDVGKLIAQLRAALPFGVTVTVTGVGDRSEQ